MKHDAKSKGCRLDLSVSELELLLHLARTGTPPALAGGMMPSIVSGLSLALAAQQAKVSDARSAAALRRSRTAGPDKRYDRSLIADGLPYRSQGYERMRMHCRDMAVSRALVREGAIREALGRWVSELEPVLVYNHEGRFCGLTHAGQPLGALVPIHVGIEGGVAI